MPVTCTYKTINLNEIEFSCFTHFPAVTNLFGTNEFDSDNTLVSWESGTNFTLKLDIPDKGMRGNIILVNPNEFSNNIDFIVKKLQDAPTISVVDKMPLKDVYCEFVKSEGATFPTSIIPATIKWRNKDDNSVLNIQPIPCLYVLDAENFTAYFYKLPSLYYQIGGTGFSPTYRVKFHMSPPIVTMPNMGEIEPSVSKSIGLMPPINGNVTYSGSNQNLPFSITDDYGVIVYTGNQYGNSMGVSPLFGENMLLRMFSTCGMYFKYDNIMYLGMMLSTGETTGELLTEERFSESAQYNSDNIYNIHDDYSGDDSDSEVDMDVGSLYSASGMVHYYSVTSENLQKLSTLMSNVDVVGTKNLLPNLISLKAFPIPFDRLGRGVVKTIEIGGVEMSDNIAGTAQGITVDSTYNFLSCCDTTIQGKYGNISNPHFLDFSPYTQVELILPLAGSVILPDNAMYKSLSVVYVYDIVNGSAICVVKSNGTVISTIPCTLSQDVPFSAINVGAKTSAMISNITNVAQNIATLGVSVGTGNLVGGISSGIGTVGSISQTVMSNNQNYIEKFGRNGDMCDFGLVKKAYIKYTRPVDIIPENFGRTNGYLCNVTKKLSDCSGFTICENPEINCSGSENEKQRIKQLLETGIYI